MPLSNNTYELSASRQEVSIFPLPDEVFEHSLSILPVFNEDDIKVIREGNLGVLPASHPDRFLFEGRVRPSIDEPGTPHEARVAYRAGLTFGRMLISDRMQDLAPNGLRQNALYPVRFKQIGKEIQSGLPWRFGIKKPDEYLDGRSEKFAKVHDFSRFLSKAQADNLIKHLNNGNWVHQSGLLTTDELYDQAIGDLVTLGVRDYFDFYSRLHARPARAPRAEAPSERHPVGFIALARRGFSVGSRLVERKKTISR